MRVLFITRKFPPSVGGMEIYSKEIYDALREAGTNIELHKPASDHLGRPSLWQMATFFFSTCWMLLRKGRSYDAVLLGDFALASVALVVKLASLGRARTVVALHGNDLYFMRKRGVVATIYRGLCRLVVLSRSLDAAIANSRAIRDEAALHSLPEPTVVPLATVAPPLEIMESATKQWRIVFAGRLIRYKGLSWFVREVWPHLDTRLELLVAGQVWDDSERECLTGQPRVNYLGTVPHGELHALRASAIACIMPNIPPASTEQDEGFGLVALEAPAVGTPTIASRCGGIPDAVADGVTGFLLPPLDAEAWIGCINRLVAWSPHQRRSFAEAAREHVMKHYNWQLVAQRTLDVLRTS